MWYHRDLHVYANDTESIMLERKLYEDEMVHDCNVVTQECKYIYVSGQRVKKGVQIGSRERLV